MSFSDRAFRSRLRAELPLWKQSGWISQEGASELVKRYRLEESGSSLAAMAIFALGALLIGGGVISLVAYNWEDLSDAAKLTLMGVFLVSAHGFGYWFWHHKKRVGLGHGLTFLGSLIFGASIGLVAQIFNIHSTWYGGLGAWAIGSLVAAYCYRSVPAAVLALVMAFLWSIGWLFEHETWIPFPPYLLGLLLVPMAFREHSRILLWLVVCGIALLSIIGAAQINAAAGFWVALAMSIACLLLDVFERQPEAPLVGTLKSLGYLGFVVASYSASFHEMAEELVQSRSDSLLWLYLVIPAFLLALTLSAQMALQVQGGLGRWSFAWKASLACWLVFLASSGSGGEAMLAVVANLVLVWFSAESILTAVNGLSRGVFWQGTLMAGLLIVSRFFEYDTNLATKGVVAVLAGAGVILAGVVFERKIAAGKGASDVA